MPVVRFRVYALYQTVMDPEHWEKAKCLQEYRNRFQKSCDVCGLISTLTDTGTHLSLVSYGTVPTVSKIKKAISPKKWFVKQNLYFIQFFNFVQ
jgi:hypothetical protein